MAIETKAQDAVLGALQRRAMEIVQAPADKREAMYAVYRNAYYEETLALSRDEPRSKELADRMDMWIKQLVEIIETSGGGAGGRA